MPDSSVGITITVAENGGVSAECTGAYEPEVNIMKCVRSVLVSRSVIILSLALLVLVIAYLFLKFYFRETRLLLGENRSLFFAVSSTNRALHFFEIVLHLRRSQDVHLAA